MEGSLLVPPDKASIIGKSLWKTRFVSLGPAPAPQALPTRSTAHRSASSSSSSRLNSSLRQLKLGSRNASQVSVDQLITADERWLCVYKHKGDHEPVAQYPLSSIVSCSIQEYTHRKTNSVQPTLILTVQTGSAKRNRQTRRLSQTASLSKSQTTTVLFRSVPSAPDSIDRWHNSLQEHLNASPPQSRSDGTFSDKSNRPSTSTARPTLPTTQGSFVSANGSYPGSILSIRTSQTAVSSPNSTSPQNAAHPINHPSSPQSEHFQPHAPYRAVATSVPSAPAARETILDRAFKMNCIPGATPPTEGEAPMNSIARFEALMQDIEARRVAERRPTAIDEDGEDEKDMIPVAAQRALEYIASGQSSGRASAESTAAAAAAAGGGGSGRAGGRASRRSRPASLALPSSSSLRSPVMDGYPTDRRRSSVSTTPSSLVGPGTSFPSTTNLNPPTTTTNTATGTSTSNKRLSLADFTRRFSSSSSVIMAARTTTTTTSSRSSGISDVSFHCVGEDDSAWGDMVIGRNRPRINNVPYNRLSGSAVGV